MATGTITNPNRFSQTEIPIAGKNTNAKLYKQGHIVVFSSSDDLRNSAAGAKIVGTIPSGYRPASNLQIAPANNVPSSTPNFMTVLTNGDIQIWCESAVSSATNASYQATWFTT